MTVVDQVPMPRVRSPQVDHQQVYDLIQRVTELEKKVEALSAVKRGRPAKTEEE
jgi:hypothetical protein